MIRIYSKLKKKKLLHIIYKPNKKKRFNITPENEFLQFSSLNLNKSDNLKAHKHFWKKNKLKKRIVQESWLVIKGMIRVTLFDLNNQILSRRILKPGEISITFEGGHKIDVLKNNTLIYEHKTGPYEGQKKDLLYFDF